MGNKNSATSSKYRRSYKKQPKKYENNSAKPTIPMRTIHIVHIG